MVRAGRGLAMAVILSSGEGQVRADSGRMEGGPGQLCPMWQRIRDRGRECSLLPPQTFVAVMAVACAEGSWLR